LGKKLNTKKLVFDNVVVGPMKRHIQTFNGINKVYVQSLSDPIIIDEFAENQLMEIAQYFIPKMLETNKNIKELMDEVPFWKRKKTFLKYFNIIAEQWINDELDLSNKNFESYKSFKSRVKNAKDKVAEIMKEGSKTMVVSSGGTITGIYDQCHPLSAEEIQQLNLKIKNASISLFTKQNDTFTLKAFNCSFIPRYLETYI
jgi:broad specificity phosphatase PhoE